MARREGLRGRGNPDQGNNRGVNPAGGNPPEPPTPDVLPQLVRELMQSHHQQNQQVQEQSARMLDGFNLLADNMHGPYGGQPRVGGVREFKFLRPPEFNGNGSPIDADEWLQQVQRLLLASNVPEVEMVNVVQVQLLGVARAWFDVLFAARGGVMTWVDFKAEFNEEFFPEDTRSLLIERFLRLEQGTRTVDDYAYEYTQLSRIATDLIPNEASKARRFVGGLRKEIKKFMLSPIPVVYREAHLNARRLELEEGSGSSVQRNTTASARKPPFLKGGQSSRFAPYSKPALSASKGSTSQGAVCAHCGKAGHSQASCWRALGKCLGCGAGDHRRADCPKFQLTPSSAPTVNRGQASVSASVTQNLGAGRGGQQPRTLPPQDQLFRQRQQGRGRGRGRVFAAMVEDDESVGDVITDDEALVKKKKSTWKEIVHNSQPGSDNAYFYKKANPVLRNNFATALQDLSFTAKETKMHETKEFFKEKKLVERPARESFVCGACGQHGHMRTNKNCPKYGEDPENSELETLSTKPSHPDAGIQQLKAQGKKLIPKMSVKVPGAEVSGSKVIPLKFKCGSSDKINEKNLQSFVSAGEESKPIKISKLIISNKMKAEDVQYETPKPSVEKDKSFKKIVIKQPKLTSNEALDLGMGYEFRKTKKITELSEMHKKPESRWFDDEDITGKAIYERSLRDEEEKRRSKHRWMPEETMIEHRSFVDTSTSYGEAFWREDEKKSKKKKKKKKSKPDFRDDYLLDHKPYRNDRRLPERDRPDRASKRRPIIDSAQLDYAPPIKRRRGAEVMLSNILESIVDNLRDNIEISFLFLKPVTRKEAPDYFDIVERPMDLSTIREKVRSMEYRSREEFRHDVWQITFNAHVYNDGRNPGIPPLADRLLELCDYHLQDKDYVLTEAESAIDREV